MSAIVMLLAGFAFFYGVYALVRAFLKKEKRKSYLKKFAAAVVVGIVCGGVGASSGGEESSQQAAQPQQEEKAKPAAKSGDWNKNLDDENAVTQNITLAVAKMKDMDAMDIETKDLRVHAEDIMADPQKYVGKIVRLPVILKESEALPAGSKGASFYDGNAHMVVGQSETGVRVMALLKGENEQLGSSDMENFATILGTFVGFQNIQGQDGKEEKLLVIAGNPQ